MDDRQLAWNRYALHIDLYQKYMDYVIKLNLFYYGITGAIMSFYFAQKGNGNTIEYALLLPLAFSIGLALFYGFAGRTYKVSMKDIYDLAKEMGLPVYVRTDGLLFLMRGSLFLMLGTAAGIGYVLCSDSL